MRPDACRCRTKRCDLLVGAVVMLAMLHAAAGACGGSVVAPYATAEAQGGAAGSGGSTDASFENAGGVAGDAPVEAAPSPCQLLVKGPTSASELKAAGEYLYFIGQGIERVPVNGGQPKPFVSTEIGGYALDADTVYWTEPTTGVVSKKPLSGGDAVTLASGESKPTRVAIQGTRLFWLAGSSIRSGSTSGEAPADLAITTDKPQDVTADDQAVYWTSHPASFAPRLVMKLALSGGTPETLASDQCDPSDIAVFGASVYWVNLGACVGGDQYGVMRVPTSGGTPTVVGNGHRGFAVDGSGVYFDEGAGLARFPLAGGTPELLCPGADAWDVAVDATTVYYTVAIPGSPILKVEK